MVLQTDELKTSSLDLARSMGSPSYISHDSVQNLVGQVWTGSIAHDVSLPMALLALVFPPYLFFFRFLAKGKYTEFQTDPQEDFVDG